MKLVKNNFNLLQAMICVFFIHISFAFAEISPDLPDAAEPTETNNLYIDKIEQIKNMQTVTYFFTEKNINNDAKYMFKKFADNLGLSHGAIIINRSGKDYLKYTKIMQCDINISSSNLIVFENRKIKRKDRQCAYFYTYDFKNINNLLATINKYIGDIEKMQSYSDYNKYRKIIMDSCLAGTGTWCKEHEKSIDNLVDMIFEKII